MLNVQKLAEFRGNRRGPEAALEQFREILSDLGTNDVQTGKPGLLWHHSLQKRSESNQPGFEL